MVLNVWDTTDLTYFYEELILWHLGWEPKYTYFLVSLSPAGKLLTYFSKAAPIGWRFQILVANLVVPGVCRYSCISVITCYNMELLNRSQWNLREIPQASMCGLKNSFGPMNAWCSHLPSSLIILIEMTSSGLYITILSLNNPLSIITVTI